MINNFCYSVNVIVCFVSVEHYKCHSIKIKRGRRDNVKPRGFHSSGNWKTIRLSWERAPCNNIKSRVSARSGNGCVRSGCVAGEQARDAQRAVWPLFAVGGI